MNLKPVNKDGTPVYPARDDHFCTSREFLRIAIALGLCTYPAILPSSQAEPPTKVTHVKSVIIPKAKLKLSVKALAEKLRDDRFKIREGATLKLIQIGLGKHSSEKEKAAARTTVMKTVSALKQTKDPEVAARARRVINALKPKPKPPARIFQDKPAMDGMVIEIE